MKASAPTALAAVLLLAGCDPKRPPAPAPAKPEAIEVVPIKSGVLSSTIPLPGQLLPYESVDIFPKAAGFIQQITVDRGSVVRKGQLLVRLNAPELGAQREQVAASLRAVEAKSTADRVTYERLANAAKTPGIVAENDVDVAREAAAADQALVASARESLKNVSQQETYLAIRAPFDGVVTTRNLHPGALVGPSGGPGGGTPILQLVATRRLRLVVPVPETDAQDIPVGQGVPFSVAGAPGRKFEAPISLVAHALDNRTRSMSVELDVANPENTLAAGEFATVQWPLRRSYPTLQVPTTAITNDQQRQFVIRVSNGVTSWVDVTTGITTAGQTEIFGDLKPGDMVVRRASDALAPGIKVQAVSR